MYRVNVLENVINRQARRTKGEPCQGLYQNVINGNWRKLCYISDEEIFCLTVMYLLKKFRKSQTRFSRKSRKNSLQSKRNSKRRSGRGCIDEKRESIQRKKKEFLKVASKCAALKSLFFLVVVVFSLDVTELSY